MDVLMKSAVDARVERVRGAGRTMGANARMEESTRKRERTREGKIMKGWARRGGARRGE